MIWLSKKWILSALVIWTHVAMAAPNHLSTAESMRNAFYSVLKLSDPSYSVESFNKLIYFPSHTMFEESQFAPSPCAVSNQLQGLNNPDAIAGLCGIGQLYNDPSLWSAKTLFALGEAASLRDTTFPILEAREQVRKKDLLIVIVPGIFSEFIEQWPFDEVLRPNSLFKSEFKQLLALDRKVNGIENCSADDKQGETSSCDTQELLKYLRDETIPAEPSIATQPNGARSVSLEKLFQVGSLDDNAGSWARVALFNVEGMSLESLGDSRDRAKIFNRRLAKLFKTIGRIPRNIVFVGYSRGTNFALDMLSIAKSENAPWLNHVKGLVSLGGVVFGSALADEVFVDTESTAAQEMRLLMLLRDTLSTLPTNDSGPYQKIRIVAQNSLAWIKFINEYIALKVPGAKSKLDYLRQQGPMVAGIESAKMFIEFLQKTAQNGGGADPGSAVNLALKQAQNFGLMPDLSSLANSADELNLEDTIADLKKAESFDFAAIGRLIKSGKRILDLLIAQYQTEGLSKYNGDILRFKKFVNAVVIGVEQLSTDSRLKWWSENSIPLHFPYYSLSATMDKKSSVLVNNRLGYNPGSPDDEMLSGNWDKFQKLKTLSSPLYSGSILNDSQVSIYKTFFWPKLIAQLNPDNSNIRSESLGILGTHHWGLALPIVNRVKLMNEGSPSTLLEKNPYPRSALLQAIALTLMTGDAK